MKARALLPIKKRKNEGVKKPKEAEQLGSVISHV